eukprot:gene17065-23357_t
MSWPELALATADIEAARCELANNRAMSRHFISQRLSHFPLYRLSSPRLLRHQICVAASSMDKQQVAPALCRDDFRQTIQLNALRVPKKLCSMLMKTFRGSTLDKTKTKCIVDDEGHADTKLLLLGESVEYEGLKQELQDIISEKQLEKCTFDLLLTYSSFSSEQVLRKLLPAGVDVPTSFECVGHIAHLNLREEHEPYKFVIGQVIMDKNPNLRTVVNKVGSIENEYRVFQMEVIAGERNLETEVLQHGSRFKLDFSQVYWNSRLETEHTRLVEKYLRPDQVIIDITSGIGPFAIPAAQKGCEVYANDLNPRSAFYLNQNVKINRVAAKVKTFNMDGREFVRLICATPGGPASRIDELNAAPPPPPPPPLISPAPGEEAIQGSTAAAAEAAAVGAATSTSKSGAGVEAPQLKRTPEGFCPPPQGVLFHHAIINLPASGIEFLDAFNGAFDPELYQCEGVELPMVHCYTFKRVPETDEDIVRKAEHFLGGKLDVPPEVVLVRDVAPNKVMLCVSFRVPESIAFNGRQGAKARQAGEDSSAADTDSSALKRQKT